MKKLSAFLVIVLMFGILSPCVFASDEMSDIVLSVKQRIEIPQECSVFQGSPRTTNGEKYYDLSWTTKEGAETYTEIIVQVQLNGIIVNYNHFTNNNKLYEYQTGKKLPSISKEEAISKALEYMAKINPSISAEYDFSKARATLYNEGYSVMARRYVNGIAVLGNDAYITLNIKTGQIQNLNVNYESNLNFPSTEKMITQDAAKQSFAKNEGLELAYVNFYNQKKEESNKVHLVYMSSGKSNAINAFTGEVYKYEGENFIGYSYSSDQKIARENAAAAPVKLTDEELVEIGNVSNLISEAEADKKLREITELDLNNELVLRSSSIRKENDKYLIYLNYENSNKEKYNSAYATLNAKTGEVLSFYSYMNTEESKTSDISTKAEAEGFKNKYFSNLNVKLKDENKNSFTWVRIENGVPFSGNSIIVEMNPQTKKVARFSKVWDESLVFESVDGVISIDSAYEKLFKQITPEPFYRKTEKGVDLVYIINFNEISYIDANDGRALNSVGEVYVKEEEKAYADIKGHFAEEAILALASVGARMEGVEFKPDSIITQNEYLTLVSQCVLNYYPIVGGRVSADRIYSNAVSNGIISKEETAPNSPLTREMAVTYLLRAMDYKKIADVKGVFKTNFTDENEIDEKLLGYVAVAQGLGIIKGSDGKFMPKKEMTRAEAVIVIYNYLKAL